MGDNTVALAAMGVLATAVAGIIWLAKFFANTLGKDLQEHTAAAMAQKRSAEDMALASRENTAASKEVLTFMKNLNGKLSKITNQTIEEQHVKHQTVDEVQS